MSQRNIYQTLEDRGNIDYVERFGPFKCELKGAWLGVGYYFWESFIDNARWWGDTAYPEKGYIIGSSAYIINPNTCFDLVDNPAHLADFRDVVELLKEKDIYIEGQTTVARVIEYMRQNNLFPYKACRVNGLNSKRKDSKFNSVMFFKEGKNYQYLELLPAVQVCFYDKSLLSSRFEVIYPE